MEKHEQKLFGNLFEKPLWFILIFEIIFLLKVKTIMDRLL